MIYATIYPYNHYHSILYVAISSLYVAVGGIEPHPIKELPVQRLTLFITNVHQ